MLFVTLAVSLTYVLTGLVIDLLARIAALLVRVASRRRDRCANQEQR